MRKIRSLWHKSDQESEIRETVIQTIPTDLVIVQSLFSLISTGTERLVAQGSVPSDLYESMKVPYMSGNFDFPLNYGYSLVGTVLSEGHELEGQTVHVMHPHQDFCVVNVKDLFIVPMEIPAQRASLASNLETAVNAIWDAQVTIGDKVLLVGFGMIGSLVARLLSLMPSIQLHILEIDEVRAEIARKMGFSILANTPEKPDYDIAFHTSCSEAGLQSCIDLVGQEGKIIELSWYGERVVKIDLGRSFHVQRKQIISSQVSALPATKSTRWDYRRRKEVVFELLKNDLFDQHITHNIDFNDSPIFFKNLRKYSPEGLGYIIRY